MAKEIERKFVVDGAGWRDLAERAIPMRQFYLAAAPDRSVRIRVIGGVTAVLTLKFGRRARERDEFEYAIPLEEAREMEAFAVGHVIEKTRYHVRHGGFLFEVDVFAGDLAGLVLAELETPDEMPDATLPAWLGREVTDEAAYSNAVLALRGRPAEPS
jgi:CYTH domain-containing protein